MANSDLVFYVELHVKPARIEEWRAAVNEIVDHMSEEETFVACYLHQDTTDECLFTLYERWSEPSVETLSDESDEAVSQSVRREAAGFSAAPEKRGHSRAIA